MRSLNKVFLMGRLGHEPQLELSEKGIPYTRLSLATHRSRKRDDDTWTESTDWHNVSVFGRQAQSCAEHLRKGALVLVEGDLKPYSTEDQDGRRQTRTSVQAHRVTFLNTSGGGPQLEPDPLPPSADQVHL